MAYVAVDKDERENLYEREPYQDGSWWKCSCSSYIKLPKGSIEKLIGYKLTWEDEPVELKEENK